MYHSGILCTSLYDDWMAVNGGTYQLGVGEEAMRVWTEVISAKPERPPLSKQRLLEIGSLPRFVTLRHCPKHGGFYVVIQWDRIGNDKEAMAVFQRIWKYSSTADATKTTVNAGNMVWHMRKFKEATQLYNKWAPLFSVSLANVTITCLLIHTVANPEAHTMFGLLADLDMCCMHTESYQEITKLISVAIRRTSKFANGDPASLDQVCLLAGWELATGRSLNKSDWLEEKRKRTVEVVYLGSPLDPKQTKESNDIYVRELLPIIRKLLLPAVAPVKRHYSWAEHIENRQSWVSSGSTGGKRLKLADGSFLRVNKHAYFESLTKGEMVKWLDTDPAIYATASEKFEPGKKRAIYGSNPTDYSIHDYVIRQVEARLSSINGLESGLTGVDYVSAMVRRLHTVQQGTVEGTMIDYTDFNYQHTLEAQWAVFEALGSCFRDRGYHPDMIRACRWTADSFLNQWVRFPNLGGGYCRVTQGMFSGVRPTNFINTVLNLAYFQKTREWVEKELGLKALSLHNIHQGDDVWITNDSRLWAMALFNSMQASGLQFQGSKQMFDRGRGEFLRVMYTREGCKAYVARAVASFTVKPIQSSDVVSPAERAVALSEHVAIMRRRGFTAEGCEIIWKATVPFAAQAKLGNKTISIPTALLLKHHRDNGLGLAAPGCAARRSLQVGKIPHMELGSVVLERSVPTHMTRDWVSLLSRQLKKPIRTEELVRILHRTNITDSLRSEDRLVALNAHLKQLGLWLTKNKPGPVVCDPAQLNKLLDGPEAEANVVRKLEAVCAKYSPKLSRTRPGKVEMLEVCIASSPFKSATTARVALGLGIIDAVVAAVSLTTRLGYKEEVLSFIQSLRTMCGDEVLLYLLDGPKTNAPYFLGVMHPLVLFWLQGLAVEEAINVAMVHQVRKVERLKDLIDDTFLRYLRSALKQPLLLQISKY